MARKPGNFEWLGYTQQQRELLDFIDHLGNNAWSRTPQLEALMPTTLANCAAEDLAFDRITTAMESVGYSPEAYISSGVGSPSGSPASSDPDRSRYRGGLEIMVTDCQRRRPSGARRSSSSAQLSVAGTRTVHRPAPSGVTKPWTSMMGTLLPPGSCARSCPLPLSAQARSFSRTGSADVGSIPVSG